MVYLPKPLLPVLCAGALLFATGTASAQQVCRGDVDDDDFVSPDDIVAATVVLFANEEDVDLGTLMRADANGDGAVTAADLIAIVRLQGFVCPLSPTRTPTLTRTATRTVPGGASPTPTASPTRTSPPTATPTQVCARQQANIGVTDGTLTQSDCRRVFRASPRYTDVYAVTATSGQAVRIEVAATGGTGAYLPYVRVVDANGFFDVAEGSPPIEFTATTTLPYQVFVTSDPGQAQQTGPYRMTLSVRTCAVRNLTTQIGSIDGSECPDFGSPTVGGRRDLADIFTFQIAQPLTRVEIVMRQAIEDSILDPVISVYGPDGYEIFPSYQADDAAPGGFGFDARARFLAVQGGAYTLVASGGGCDPADPDEKCGYRITFSTGACPTTSAGTLPSTGPKVIAGTLYGDTRRTVCPAPVSIPGFNEFGEPEVNSVMDAYTFTATAGEIFSAEMDSEGEPQLSLFGPLQSGNPFVAQNDLTETGFVSQIAATLTRDGTYTLLAANRTFLEAPDPNDPEDPGDFVEYEAFLQKCPISGGLVPSIGSTVNARFRVTDCLGYDDYPFQSFAFNGTAGEIISTTMSSTAVNASVRVLGANTGVTVNDDDPFASTTDARAIRTIPATGVYFAEMSTSRDATEPNLGPGPAFAASGRACPPKVATLGAGTENFSDGDCDFGGGRKYDVFTLEGSVGLPPRPFVISVEPPATACVLGLLPEGPQMFRKSCSKQTLDIPVVGVGPAAFVIAADSAATRGAYALNVRVCPLPVLGLGAAHSSSLASAGCTDASGVRADWVLFQDRAGLVRFNEGLLLSLDAGFASASSITAAFRTTPLGQRAVLDPTELLPLGANLAALVKIRGATAGDRGNYTLQIEPPVRRQ